jgi:hypothetical protein
MSRGRVILDALWPTLLLWIGLILFALWRDGDFPNTGDGWQNFLIICLLIELFSVKSLLMLRGLHDCDWLTISLIATNLMLAFIFLVQQALALWQSFFFVDHLTFTQWMIRGLEAVLAIFIVWTVWEMANVAEEPS